ncbi:MAG: hypothetical protein AB1733_22870 [Thermodesulfobacteriota bacterium]
MKTRIGFALSCMFLLMLTAFPAAWGATPGEDDEAGKDGLFLVTLKSLERRTMTEEELVRDRDLNPRFLYRVRTGGYIGFDEKEWVDKIEFKVFPKPVTELPEYQRFSRLLAEINEKIWLIKQTLAKYDLLAMRLMNICDRSKFSSLEAIDDNILQQLTVYRKLVLLRSLVVNSLTRVVTDRACRDLFNNYQTTLNIYTKQLTELTRNYERLSRRTLMLIRDTPTETEKTKIQ